MSEVPHEAGRAVAVEAAALHRVLTTALGCPALVAEFDRLAGTHVAAHGSALERAIDDASGPTAADIQRFLAFAKDPIWDRFDDATRDDLRAQVAPGATA